MDRHAGSNAKTLTFTDEERRLAPEFQDIHISRVVCRGAKTAIKAAGIEGLNCIHDIDIRDCAIIYNKVGKQIDEPTARLSLVNVKLTENKLR